MVDVKNINTKGKNRRKFRSSMNPKQQRLAATTVVLLAVIVLTSMISLPHTHMVPVLRSSETHYSEIIAKAMPPSFNSQEAANRDHGTCTVLPAVVPAHPVTPTFTASYPGSGAKMTWNLIEAITGLVTGDDFQLNGHQNMVSIKTHYPSHEGREVPGAENIPRAILLIRHPLYSIPSYFNFIYEMENNLENHSTRAPVEAWIAWRNDNFDRQLQVWRRHTEYWMDHFSKINRLVVSYEKLTDDYAGPIEATRIAEFLSRSDGVSICPPKEIPCVWHTVVKYKKGRRMLQEVGVIDREESENAELQAANPPEMLEPFGATQDQGEALPPPGGDTLQEDPRLEQESVDHQELNFPQNQEVQEAPQPPEIPLVEENAASGEVTITEAGNDPNKPQSKRGGPKYIAPYNERQLRDLLQVLTQLLERYRDEKALAPILVSYIDEVARRSEGPPEDLNTVVVET